MKKFYQALRGALVAGAVALAAVLPTKSTRAQVVSQLPVSMNINSITDFGNGPVELRVLQGNGWLFTSQGAGLGSTSGSSTTLTLTASAAADPPCVGCLISGAGITSGTTVSAFNGTTTITLSAAMTVSANTPLSWGMACPTYTTGMNPPVPSIAIQAGNSQSDLPMYTQARVCGLAQNGPGAQLLPFPIGAH